MTSESAWIVVGAGRVGRTIAGLLARHGRLAGICVRREESLAAVAHLPSAVVRCVGPDALPDADRIVLAVPDASIRSAVQSIPAAWRGTPGRCWLHVSGAAGPEVFHGLGIQGSAGACHPLLSFQGDAADEARLVGALFALDGDASAVAAGRELAEMAGGEAVQVVGPEQRAAYHLAATLASNGVYALLRAAGEVLGAAGLPGALLAPGMARLAAHSAESARERGPEAAATGPVMRGDAATLHRHLQALDGASADVVALYRSVSAVLIDVAEARGLRPGQAAALRVVLAAAVDGSNGDGRGAP